MSYRLPDHLPTDREPHAVIPSVARPSHIVVDNGTITRINVPCFYARRFTRRDRMIWDHMTWPSPDHPDGSDYADALAIADVDLADEGYTAVLVELDDAPDGLSVTGQMDYNHVQLTVSAVCEGANDENLHVRFAVYLTGSDTEVGQLRDLVTKGTLHVKAGYVGTTSPEPEPEPEPEPTPDTYVITYMPNGASSQTSHMQYVQEGNSARIIGNPFSRTDYTFTIWNTMADGTGTDYAEHQLITPTSSMVLYAQWVYVDPDPEPEPGPEPEEYVISYYPNGGNGSVQTQQVTPGEVVYTIMNPFTNSGGYEFSGWGTTSGGYGTRYAENQPIQPTSDMSLYAQWESLSYYTITFQRNGAVAGWMPIMYVDKGMPSNLPPNQFVWPGHTFRYWCTSPTGQGMIYMNAAQILPRSDMTLYAIWD